MNHWQELKTINDFVDSCKEVIANYREDLSAKDKERMASTILALTFSDKFEAWQKEHEIVERIEAYASDLEWSNSLDVDEDWDKLIGYIRLLDGEVGSNNQIKT